MQQFSHWRLALPHWRGVAWGVTDEERESGLSPFRGIPVKVVSHPCRVYRDHSVLRHARQLPVPTVEHLSMGPGLDSRLDPEDHHVDRESCPNKFKVKIKRSNVRWSENIKSEIPHIKKAQNKTTFSGCSLSLVRFPVLWEYLWLSDLTRQEI